MAPGRGRPGEQGPVEHTPPEREHAQICSGSRGAEIGIPLSLVKEGYPSEWEIAHHGEIDTGD